MKFIDETQFVLASGAGGDGCVSFRREKFVPRGGPDGGDGGRGGHVRVVATRRRNTLVDLRRNKVYRAQSGRPGKGRKMNGPGGADLQLLVPIGTMLFDRDTGERIADLDSDGAEWVLEGGRGGKGNVHFRSSTQRTPLRATNGTPGTEIRVRAELKLLADVGLLGFPNAGKSTLISTISAARPRVADYPFTTLVPNLGVVVREPGESFVVADIPGLIEGAAEGAGLGHRFLRHVERCSVYLHLVPLEAPEGAPEELYGKLQRELERYDSRLAERPQLVVLTKTDLCMPEDVQEAVERLEAASGGPVHAISAPTRSGLRELLDALWLRLAELRAP